MRHVNLPSKSSIHFSVWSICIFIFFSSLFRKWRCKINKCHWQPAATGQRMPQSHHLVSSTQNILINCDKCAPRNWLSVELSNALHQLRCKLAHFVWFILNMKTPLVHWRYEIYDLIALFRLFLLHFFTDGKLSNPNSFPFKISINLCMCSCSMSKISKFHEIKMITTNQMLKCLFTSFMLQESTDSLCIFEKKKHSTNFLIAPSSMNRIVVTN